MWTEYSVRYIKNNKVSSICLAAISFIAAAFLSFLCSLGYNLWVDHVNQIIALEGNYTKRPEPLAAAYIFVISAACASLVMMIHNAFEVPMNNRIHQLGILQSVGASPKQIRSFLMQEMLILCFVPILLGTAAGIALSGGFIQAAVSVTDDIRTYAAAFHFHIMAAVFSLLVSGLTVIFSAWIPAGKISKLSPLAALSCGIETNVTKMRRFRFFSKISGIYGELGRKSIYARRKELRTSALSLTFAFLSLIGLLNVETISGISTQYTYFERFRDKWDLMLVTDDNAPNHLTEIKSIAGVRDCTAYQKINAETVISETAFSREAGELGIGNLTEKIKPDGKGGYLIAVPIYILDEESFASYCGEHEIAQNGAVLVNTLWDSIHSSRKNREYVPLVDPETAVSIEIEGKQFTVDAFSCEMPEIKEEYQQYSLTLILSERFYRETAGTLPAAETVYNIRLAPPEWEDRVQAQIRNLLEGHTGYELTSRMEEESTETEMRNGLKRFIYAFAGILACIGITNIFSFALGQIFQRKKEFARYFSVGMPQSGMRKILAMEALIICFRPLVISVLVNLPILIWALSAAEITVSEYMAESPLLPVGVFTLAVFLSVMGAYYLGGRRICGDLAEMIKDETML